MALPCCSGFDRPQTEKVENENVPVRIVGKRPVNKFSLSAHSLSVLCKDFLCQ